MVRRGAAVRKALLREVTFLQRLEGKEGVSRATAWARGINGQGPRPLGPGSRGGGQAQSDFLLSPTAAQLLPVSALPKSSQASVAKPWPWSLLHVAALVSAASDRS